MNLPLQKCIRWTFFEVKNISLRSGSDSKMVFNSFLASKEGGRRLILEAAKVDLNFMWKRNLTLKLEVLKDGMVAFLLRGKNSQKAL